MRKVLPIIGFLFLLCAGYLVYQHFAEKDRNLPAPYATTGWETRASEWTALTAALYWEGQLEESTDGLRAIAWTIRNRVKSADFPNTVRGVVTEGYKKGKQDGCQYSFVCNGAGESPAEFQRLMRRMGIELSLEQCLDRWLRYSKVAADFLEDPGKDLTGGANHYWARTMKVDPYWVKTDIVTETIRTIGSHKFGWSRYRGEDVPHLALK